MCRNVTIERAKYLQGSSITELIAINYLHALNMNKKEKIMCKT